MFVQASLQYSKARRSATQKLHQEFSLGANRSNKNLTVCGRGLSLQNSNSNASVAGKYCAYTTFSCNICFILSLEARQCLNFMYV